MNLRPSGIRGARAHRRHVLVLTAVVASALIAFQRVEAQRQAPAGEPQTLAAARARGLEALQTVAQLHGFGPQDDLAVTQVHVDRLAMAHTRVQQRYRGIPVWGGEAIAHFDAAGALFARTDDLVTGISVDTTPRVTADEAIAGAVAEYGCSDCLTATPSADLWILRRAGVDYLTYRVQLRREDGTNETSLPVIFVDASVGGVIWRYDNLQTGTGPSLYSGLISVGTSYNASSAAYFMENIARRIGTFDMNNTETSTFRFNDADDYWNASWQRAGLDVQFGAERYLDYLASTHGRNGLDGSGGPYYFLAHDGATPLISSRVHYGNGVVNAFWNGSVMTYGDGDGIASGPLVSLDIVAHEMTHAVTEFTAGLIYSGESGALNESWSDVVGAMTERYVRGETANTWLIGEDAVTPGVPGDALRYMDNPHRAASSGLTADDDPDHYSERYVGSLDNGGVHINSGIANKAFYLLAKGGAHHLGGSMTGIGADAAARIWFVALTSYMTSSTNFAGARVATLNAASALYGAASTQRAAVSMAWCLVGVGTCAPPTVDSVSPASGAGVAQTFTLRYSDPAGATNISTAWVWFTPSFGSAASSSCMLYYDRAANQVYLLNDAGSAWTPAAPGSGVTLQNSQCAVAMASSSAAASGNTLTLTLAMSFKAPFAGSKNVYLYAANATGANSSWQDRGDWTAVAPSVVTADSVTPGSGSGAAQTFALKYSDSAGAASLRTTWVWFNPTMASAVSSCMVYFDAPTNTLFLLNDAATAWQQAVAGSGGVLQNAQCSVSASGTSATVSGNILTLNLAVTFKPAFAGAKNIYMYADAPGGVSGWHDRGDWTVTTVTATVTADSVTPGSGSGAAQSFALHYSDSLGATDLATAWVWFTDTFGSGAARSCMLYYDRPADTVFLLDDAGSHWQPAALGGAVTVQNSQCALAAASSSAAVSGTTLTLNLSMTFKPAFAGDANVYMYAASAGGTNSGWQDRGDWTVPGSPTASVAADAVSPSSGSGSGQTFALQYSDSLGAADLSTAWVWFTGSFGSSAAGSCMVYYARVSETVFLLNDAGTAWQPAALSSGATLQNSQCAIALGSSSATSSGTSLTLTLATTFKSGYAGAKDIYMYAANAAGANSGWQDRGDWTATTPVLTVTADSATPSSGSGSSQAFALQYSDTLGAADLRQTWVWFTPIFGSTAANSCMVYVDRPTNTLFLLNDAGSVWQPVVIGTAATVQNSQCAIAAASSAAVPSGSMLTLTLDVTFKPGFAGSKNIYLYANSSSGSDSGWQDRGEWVVPE